MSPLFLVNWHRVNGHFRTLMWMVALVLAAFILLKSVPAPQAAPAQTPRTGLHYPAATPISGGTLGAPAPPGRGHAQR
jgi:hypothetical protein